MARRNLRAKHLLLPALLALAATPAQALLLATNAQYTNRVTGATLNDADIYDSGTVSAIVAAPTTSGLDVTSAVAESIDTGTFWSSARSGGLDPYLMEAFALYEVDGVRTTESAFIADITGATLELIDWGSFYQMDLTASYSFEAFLDNVSVVSFAVTLSGRGGFGAGGGFTASGAGIDPEASYLVQPSGYVSSVRHQLDPRSVAIDLTGIGVGDTYRVRLIATATAANAGGETAAAAWFRDPATGAGGITVRTETGAPNVSVPEPGSLPLLSAGLLAFVALRRRSQKPLLRPSDG